SAAQVCKRKNISNEKILISSHFFALPPVAHQLNILSLKRADDGHCFCRMPRSCGSATRISVSLSGNAVFFAVL
ncbi:MAG TPA: hypothetical protein VFD87_04195, partial [Phototrophicaceae bacterium]|nr:hypothetical protein [Phototrophicaceae bacterium]